MEEDKITKMLKEEIKTSGVASTLITDGASIFQLTDDELIKMLEEKPTIMVLQDHKIPEDFILKYPNKVDKTVLIQNQALSEKFINSALESRYLEESDLIELSMTTYSTLSKDFLDKHRDSLNWKKLMMYLLSSDQIKDMKTYIDIINKYNMWSSVSACQLPIDFIREYKDFLDWKLLSLTNYFNKEQAEEFSGYAEIIVRED